LIENASKVLPSNFRLLIDRLLNNLDQLDRQVGELEAEIKAAHRANEMSKKLERIPGMVRSRQVRSSPQ
jgi:transposase